jgi:hypothetical protein
MKYNNKNIVSALFFFSLIHFSFLSYPHRPRTTTSKPGISPSEVFGIIAK